MTFVLVHGGWHGGWAWQRLAPLLTQATGRAVLAPTMTGLGDRHHLTHPGITPDLHVEDIVQTIEAAEAQDLILVGHSYGGFIITGVAGRMPERVRALVYLDAFVPTQSGQSAFSIGSPERAAEVRRAVGEGFLVPPIGFERWSDDPGTLAWLRRRCVPHPLRCFAEGPTLTGREAEVARRLYLWCRWYDPSPFSQFYRRYAEDPGWKVAQIDALHDAMLDAPQAVSDAITSFLERHP
jgi:pimeloyl-ACP methyl ester carboxylesterase